MGSRLSSLLVRKGLVGVDEMQDAFTRQVVRGGALDTILLERKRVSEEVLLTLLGRSLGIPHMAPDAQSRQTPALADSLSFERAEELGICPIAISDSKLVVLFGEESDSEALVELAQELGQGIECFAATELRIVQLRCELYEEKIPRRFERLLKKLGTALPVAAELDEDEDDDVPHASQPHLRAAALAWAEAAGKDTTEQAIVQPEPEEPEPEEEDEPEPEEEDDEPEPEEPEPEEEDEPEPEEEDEPEPEEEDEPEPEEEDEPEPEEEDEPEPEEEDEPEPEEEDEPEEEEKEHGEDLRTQEEVQQERPETIEEQAAALASVPTEVEPSPPVVVMPDFVPAVLDPDDPEALLSQDTIDVVPPLDPEAPEGLVGQQTLEAEPPVDADASQRHSVTRMRRVTDENPEIIDDQPAAAPDTALSLKAEGSMLEAIDPALGARSADAQPAAGQHKRRAGPGFTKPTPLDLDEALIAMHASSSRDDVLLSLLRGSYRYLSAIDLFVRQGRKLVGRFALRERVLDGSDVRNRSIPLDLPSVVSRAAGDGAIYIGPSPDTDASATVLLDADILAPHLAIVPVMLRERAVCLLIGHHQEAPIPGGVRGPLDRLANEAAKALAQLIVRKKHTSAQASTEEVKVVQVEMQAGAARPPRVMAPVDVSGEIDATPARDHLLGDGEDKVIIALDVEIANRTAEDLVDSLEEGRGDASEILNELRRRGRPGIDALLNLFPGKLRLDRNQAAELPLVSECSTVLRVLMHVGRPVIPSLAPLLVHGDDDVRFYATYLLSELIFPESVVLLAGRLQDDDPAVRRAAAYGLRRCRELPQFADILQDLREDLTHPDSRPRRAAMEALAALGDVVATPSLVAQLKDSREDVVSSAHRSLVTLTKQDFGQDPAQWRRWWERHRQRNRIEWLIEGLVHKKREIRESASIELRELTGMAFGYNPDLDSDAREEIRRKYVVWWSERGLNGQAPPS